MDWSNFDEKAVRRRLPIGGRVRMSPEGLRQFPRYKGARGTVIRYIDGLPTIRWDHRRTDQRLAPWFLLRVRTP